MTPKHRVRLSKLSLGLIVALAAAPAFAQKHVRGVGGTILDASGQPVAGAEVTIMHVESGTVRRVTTDANGRYNARGLRVGGPYTINVTKSGEGTTTEENIYLSLNQVSQVNASLGGDITTLDGGGDGDMGVDVRHRQYRRGHGQWTPAELMPTGSRSIDDVARLDPRISVIDQASGSISVAGVNNRYNTISVDGLSQGDPFGLNSNGMPYTGSPISMDTIEAFDIKISDYDVSTDTIGATVNAVTKSGTNEFSGSVYYVYKDAENMVGSRDGQDYALFDKDEVRGVTFGGPIIGPPVLLRLLRGAGSLDFGGATEDSASPPAGSRSTTSTRRSASP